MGKKTMWILVVGLCLVIGYSGFRILRSLDLSQWFPPEQTSTVAPSGSLTKPTTRPTTKPTTQPTTHPTLPTDPADPLQGKTAIFLGDSICAGTTVGEENPYHGYGWAGLIGSEHAMAWENFGQNGAVILGQEPTDRVLREQLLAAKNRYETVDYILLEGGCNDAYRLKWDAEKLGEISPDFENFDENTFTGALELLLRDVKAAYPEAKIGYILTHKMGEAPFDAEHHVIRAYYERILAVCEKWQIPCLDLWQESSLDPSDPAQYDPSLTAQEAIDAGKFFVDAQHLTLEGYRQLLPLIEDFMKEL